MKNKSYIGLFFVAFLLLPGFASGRERPERSFGAHTLNLSYSPVLRNAYYQEWKTISPLKFSLNYTYDIPMRSRVVNFYAIGEVSYITAASKGVHNITLKEEEREFSFKKDLNALIVSVGIGLKVHLASFLDLSVFYTGGCYYKHSQDYIERFRDVKWGTQDYSNCVGARLVGKINKINVFVGYSFTHLLHDGTYNFYNVNYIDNSIDHYLDIGIGYTF